VPDSFFKLNTTRVKRWPKKERKGKGIELADGHRQADEFKPPSDLAAEKTESDDGGDKFTVAYR
jgi:hypothetical protein